MTRLLYAVKVKENKEEVYAIAKADLNRALSFQLEPIHMCKDGDTVQYSGSSIQYRQSTGEMKHYLPNFILDMLTGSFLTMCVKKTTSF